MTSDDVAKVEDFYREVEGETMARCVPVEKNKILAEPPIVLFIQTIAESMDIKRCKPRKKVMSVRL